MEIIQSKQQLERQILKSNIWQLWDNIKYANIHIIGFHITWEEKREEKRISKACVIKVVAVDFPNERKEMLFGHRQHRGSLTRWAQTYL